MKIYFYCLCLVTAVLSLVPNIVNAGIPDCKDVHWGSSFSANTLHQSNIKNLKATHSSSEIRVGDHKIPLLGASFIRCKKEGKHFFLKIDQIGMGAGQHAFQLLVDDIKDHYPNNYKMLVSKNSRAYFLHGNLYALCGYYIEVSTNSKQRTCDYWKEHGNSAEKDSEALSLLTQSTFENLWW